MKYVAILTVLLLLAVPAFGQDNDELGPKAFGFKGGLSMANVGGNDTDGTEEIKIGFAGGVFFTMPLAKGLSLVPELVYVQKGTKWEEDGASLKVNFDYIELPILLSYQFPMEGNFKPKLFAGPTLGLLVSSKMTYEESSVSADIDIANGKSIDFGLAFGGGFDVVMAKGMLTFDARYSLGLGAPLDDMTQGEYDDAIANDEMPLVDEVTFEAPEINHQGIQLYVGYAFFLGY
jgi:hypothetical protein